MTTIKISIAIYFLAIAITSHAQNNETFEQYRDRMQNEFQSFRNAKTKEFEDFRNKVNAEFAQFRETLWREMKGLDPIPQPHEEPPTPPITLPDNEIDIPIESNPIAIEEVIAPPAPEPQPAPIVPIEAVPQQTANYVTFVYCGTTCKVRYPKDTNWTLRNLENDEYTKAWTELSSEKYNNTILDCLQLRTDLQLSDWAYLNMLDKLSETCCRTQNDRTFIMTYLLSQSGYKVRLALVDNSNLVYLVSSKHLIYNIPYIEDSNSSLKYYCFKGAGDRYYVYDFELPGEKQLSLYITNDQLFAYDQSSRRTLTSKRYPDVNVSVTVNKNLVEFYDTYPVSQVNNNIMTRWAMYAEAPFEQKIKDQIYPTMKSKIAGKSELESVEILLNWVQTAFVYEYDDVVWQRDRIFFAEESLYYPYCDCEDRSILFSRLVRDLVGLNVILVYYPGHLATAVCFNELVNGDYIKLNNKRYTIADPTFINACVGRTMPNHDNSTAKVILLE